MAVVLNTGGPQSGQAMLVDGELPAQEFLGGKGITLAGFLKAEKTAADGCDDFGLAADDPSSGRGRRKIRDRQRASIWPDDVFDSRAAWFGHDTLYNSTDLSRLEATCARLRYVEADRLHLIRFFHDHVDNPAPMF